MRLNSLFLTQNSLPSEVANRLAKRNEVRMGEISLEEFQTDEQMMKHFFPKKMGLTWPMAKL